MQPLQEAGRPTNSRNFSDGVNSPTADFVLPQLDPGPSSVAGSELQSPALKPYIHMGKRRAPQEARPNTTKHANVSTTPARRRPSLGDDCDSQVILESEKNFGPLARCFRKSGAKVVHAEAAA